VVAQEHGQQLATKYGGQYVVVHDGRIVACGKTQLEAYQKAGLPKAEGAAHAPGVRSSCETGIYYIPPSGKPAAAV
jgi:ABC-type hemin transport system ATPase subunit